MANWYGENATLILNTNPAQKADKGDQGGVVRVIRDVFDISADLASADVIYLGGKLPKNAKILDAHLYFTDLDTSGGTVDVGWQAAAEVDSAGTTLQAADTDALFDGVDVATAADCLKASDQAAAQLAKWKDFKFAGDVQFVLTTDGDTDATSGKIVFELFYVLD